jgi:hypothetical protein
LAEPCPDLAEPAVFRSLDARVLEVDSGEMHLCFGTCHHGFQ